MNTDVISISGAKCGDICNKLASMGRTYKNITLVVGGNDCSSSMETNGIIENFALLVACAKSCATESVSVTSICPRPENPIVQDRNIQVNIALKTASEKHDFKFIDTNDMFTLKDVSINDGYLLDDGVHLTYKGTEKLAQKLHVLNYKEAVIRQPKAKSYSQRVGKGSTPSHSSRYANKSSFDSYISVNETWLNASISDGEVSVDGFDLFRNDRDVRRGGVALYVKQSLKPEIVTDLMNHDIECLWVKVTTAYNNHILVCSFYRKPSAPVPYFNNILMNFQTAVSYNLFMVILGDFNFNYENENCNSNIHNIESICNMTQLNKEATRETTISSTIIDLIFTTNEALHKSSGVLNTTLGCDHKVIYTVVRFKTAHSPGITIRNRNYKNL